MNPEIKRRISYAVAGLLYGAMLAGWGLILGGGGHFNLPLALAASPAWFGLLCWPVLGWLSAGFNSYRSKPLFLCLMVAHYLGLAYYIFKSGRDDKYWLLIFINDPTFVLSFTLLVIVYLAGQVFLWSVLLKRRGDRPPTTRRGRRDTNGEATVAQGVMLLLCLFMCASAAAQERVISARAGRVTRVEGEVVRRPRGGREAQTLSEGVTLDDGDVVLTLDKAHTDWSLTPDSYLHVGPGSLVTARATGFDRMHFDVERGEVLVVARSLKKGVSLVVHTPPGSLTVHKPGRYLFRVAEDGVTEATVGKGELRYRDERGEEVKLKKGKKSRLPQSAEGD